jgi:hypothetical protein
VRANQPGVTALGGEIMRGNGEGFVGTSFDEHAQRPFVAWFWMGALFRAAEHGTRPVWRWGAVGVWEGPLQFGDGGERGVHSLARDGSIFRTVSLTQEGCGIEVKVIGEGADVGFAQLAFALEDAVAEAAVTQERAKGGFAHVMFAHE